MHLEHSSRRFCSSIASPSNRARSEHLRFLLLRTRLLLLCRFAWVVALISLMTMPTLVDAQFNFQAPLDDYAADDANAWVVNGKLVILGGTLTSTREPYYNGIFAAPGPRQAFKELSSTPLSCAAIGPGFSVADPIRSRVIVCYSGSLNSSSSIVRNCVGVKVPAGSDAANGAWETCYPANNVPRYGATVVATRTYIYVIGGTAVGTGAYEPSYERALLADACTANAAWDAAIAFTAQITISGSSGVVGSPFSADAFPTPQTVMTQYLYIYGVQNSGEPAVAIYTIDSSTGVPGFGAVTYLAANAAYTSNIGQASVMWDIAVFPQFMPVGEVGLFRPNYIVVPSSLGTPATLSTRPAAVGYLGAMLALPLSGGTVYAINAFSTPPFQRWSSSPFTIGTPVQLEISSATFATNAGLSVMIADSVLCDAVWASCSSDSAAMNWTCDTSGISSVLPSTGLEVYVCFGFADSIYAIVSLTSGACLTNGYALQSSWTASNPQDCAPRNTTLTSSRSWVLAGDVPITVMPHTTTTTTTATLAPTTTSTTTTTTTLMPTTTTTTTTTSTTLPPPTTTTPVPTTSTTTTSTMTTTQVPTTMTSTTTTTEAPTTTTTTEEPTTTTSTTTTTTTEAPTTTTTSLAPTTSSTTLITTTTSAPTTMSTTTAAPTSSTTTSTTIPSTSTTTSAAPTTTSTSTEAPTTEAPTTSTSTTEAPTETPIPSKAPVPSGLGKLTPYLIPINAVLFIVIASILVYQFRHRLSRCTRASDDSGLADDERFGKYRLKDKIAHGGQGTVYLIERRHDKQEFALKFIVCHDNNDRMAALREFEMMQSCKGHSNMIELVDMFMNWEEDDAEAEAAEKRASQGPPPRTSNPNSTELGTVNDPNLPLLQSPADDTAALASLTHAPRFVAIVTEYYPAGSLQKYILSRTQPIPEVLIWSSMFQIANLLHFLHTRSPPVLHQDIKPENVLIDLKLNRLVVTDFGLAAKMMPNFKGKCNGTRFFMSPEANTGSPSEKTDIWALGCVLYVLCNRSAAVDRNDGYFFNKVRNIEFEDEIVHEIEELGYSYSLADMCVNMLKLKVEERLSAEEVIMWCQRECADLDKAKF